LISSLAYYLILQHTVCVHRASMLPRY